MKKVKYDYLSLNFYPFSKYFLKTHILHKAFKTSNETASLLQIFVDGNLIITRGLQSKHSFKYGQRHC